MSVTNGLSTPELREQYAAALELSVFIPEHLDQEAQLDLSGRLAVASYCLALDHREGLMLLVCAGARSTAHAVLRPLIESFYRGLWLERVADDAQLQQFARGRGPTFESMVQAIKRRDPDYAPLANMKAVFGPVLDDLTHGGPHQLGRWIDEVGTIAPTHTPEDVIDSLHFADVVALWACIARQRCCGKSGDAFEDKLQEVARRISTWQEREVKDS